MTLLVGDNTNTGTTNVGPNTYGDIEFCSYVAAASGSATDGYFYTTTTGLALILAVYDSAATTLLGTSSEVTSSVSGWNHVTFSPSVSIVSGTTYTLAICADDTASSWDVGSGATAGSPWHYFNPTSAYFPTPPASLTITGAGTANTLSAYVTSAAAAVQHGHPSVIVPFGSTNMPWAERFFAANSPKLNAKALAMFMPLSWVIGRRNKLRS